MRSQSLFNFFTKAAAGGPRVHTGADAQKLRASTEASARVNEQAHNQYSADMARRRRYDVNPDTHYAGEFGLYLRDESDPEFGGSVRRAYSQYMDNMRHWYTRGEITREQLYDARSQARARLSEDQFNRMWHAYQNAPARHEGSPDQMYDRMINDSNQAYYIFTPNSHDKGWNPGNMTYRDFERFITTPSGHQMLKADALEKWNNAVQARERYAGRVNGRNGTAVGARPAVGSNTDESWRGEGFRQQQALEAEYADRKRNAKNPATPLTFKGGYAVNYNPAYVKDWTRPTEPTSNNVGGIWYTDEQYMAYKDVTNQLRAGMLANGMSQAQANAEASRLAKLYMDDQMRLASNHTANNKWMEQPPAAAPAQPTAPADKPKVRRTAGGIPLSETEAAPAAPKPTAAQANTPLSPEAARAAYQKELREMQPPPTAKPKRVKKPQEETITVGAPITYPEDTSSIDPLLQQKIPGMDVRDPKNFDPNAIIRLTPDGKLEYYTPNTGRNSTITVGAPLTYPENTPIESFLPQNIPGLPDVKVPENYDANSELRLTPDGKLEYYTPESASPASRPSGTVPSLPAVNNTAQAVETPAVTAAREGEFAPITQTSIPTTQTKTWDIESGIADVDGYIKHHTQPIDVDAALSWYGDGFTQKQYHDVARGRAYDNMIKLYELASDARLTPEQRQKVMASLRNEAYKYNYNMWQRDRYTDDTEYDPGLSRQPVPYMEEYPGDLSFYDSKHIPAEITDLINNYYD